MFKYTRKYRSSQKQQSRRRRTMKGGENEENKERAAYKHWIDILFFGARNTTFGVPDRYRMTIMRSMASFALEQLAGGDPEDTQIIYDAFEKWSGERYIAKNSNNNE